MKYEMGPERAVTIGTLEGVMLISATSSDSPAHDELRIDKQGNE